MNRKTRSWDALRPIQIQRNYLKQADASVLVSYGNTIVLCTASIEASVPGFLRGQGQGWVTAEYAMLPGATRPRSRRESKSGKQTGRTQEIQRLIGRSLRAVVDMKLLGEISIVIDADVLQADGGTRTAAITGGMVALSDSIQYCLAHNMIRKNPIREWLSAVSVGIRGGQVFLDLDYEEDATADVDMNVVMTESGRLVEVQGTAEHQLYDRSQLNAMLDVAEVGIHTIIQQAKQAS